jgi:F-type H+-transporting ATPase subunit b
MKLQNRYLKASYGAALSAALLSAFYTTNAFAADMQRAEELLHDVEDISADIGQGVHEAGEAGLPQLAIDTYVSQIFWLIIAFAIMYAVFSKKILPNISEILERRRETIASDLETAESLREEAESVQAEYEEAISKAQSEGAALLQELNAKISAEMETEYNSFKESSQSEVDAAEAKAREASQAMMADLQNAIPELTATIVQKLTGLEPTEKEAQAAVSSQAEVKAKAA